MIIPVILSGGSGTRLWPLSTPQRPKQFLPLIGDKSLFHETLARVSDETSYNGPIVVGNIAHEGLLREEIARRPGAILMLEPVARNTAVAIAMAAHVAAARDPDALLLVMPSDHRIGEEAVFHDAVSVGLHAAAQGKLVTFGIHPTAPSTGYGYLQAGDPLPGLPGVRSVAQFKEKPDSRTAAAMIDAGGFYWNGGIFLFGAKRFLEECAALAPDIYRCCIEALKFDDLRSDTICPRREVLSNCPDISIDYAVMERSHDVAMVVLDAQWSDVGSWDALADISDPSLPVAYDSEGCFVRTDGLKVALLGVKDLIVVGSGNQIAIIKRGRSQEIKRLAALAAND